MRNYDIGVDQDKLIILNNSKNIQLHAESVKTELLTIPGIDAVSFTNCIPGRGARVSDEISWEGKDPSERLLVWCVISDYDYNKTVNIKMIKGRFFDPSFSTDSSSYLINDVAAKVMKNEDPVGSTITIEGQKGTVIGVFKDFHSVDLAGPLTPTIILIRPDFKPIILVKYSAASFQGITDEIRKVYQHYDSETPFQTTLFRDLTPYSNLDRPSQLVGSAFIIALLLACMGFFGLASFTAETRTKEIGIRKATGATISSVLRLLLTSYTRWLTFAFIIAVPIAFMTGKSFLGRFYFHTPMPLWAFIAGPVIAFVVAMLTVSSQTWTVARQNPVKALRYE